MEDDEMPKRAKPTRFTRDKKYDDDFHELCTSTPDEVLERLSVRRYDNPRYIENETLLSLFRREYISRPEAHRNSPYVSAITRELERRSLSWAEHYIRTHGFFGGALADLQEAARDIVSMALEMFLKPHDGLTFPECHFGKFLERRALDYSDQVNALKHAAVSSFTDAIPKSAPNEDDDPAQFFEQLRDADTPELKVERRQLYAKARKALRTKLSADEQTAIILRVELELPWSSSDPNEQSVAGYMGIDEDQARYLARKGLAKIKGALK